MHARHAHYWMLADAGSGCTQLLDDDGEQMCKTKGWLCLTNGQKNGRGRVRVVGLGAYDVLHIASVRPWRHHWHFLRIKTTTRRMRGRQAFLRIRFPGKTWTSIAVLGNLHVGLHHDGCNFVDHTNHAIILGSFQGGRVWVEDESGTSCDEVRQKNKMQTITGTWHNLQDKRLSFDARRAITRLNCMKGTWGHAPS